MLLPANDAVGKLLLRVTLGLLILLHGIAKITQGVDGIATGLVANGLPGFIAYGVYVGEVLAPLMLIAGFYARVNALLIAVNMIFAIALVHSADMFNLGRAGGAALELQYMYLLAAISVALLGPGRYSISEE